VKQPKWFCFLRVFSSCPLITPKDARSSLQMRAMSRAMAVLCAWIGRLLTRCSVTLEKFSASKPDTSCHTPAFQPDVRADQRCSPASRKASRIASRTTAAGAVKKLGVDAFGCATAQISMGTKGTIKRLLRLFE